MLGTSRGLCYLVNVPRGKVVPMTFGTSGFRWKTCPAHLYFLQPVAFKQTHLVSPNISRKDAASFARMRSSSSLAHHFCIASSTSKPPPPRTPAIHCLENSHQGQGPLLLSIQVGWFAHSRTRQTRSGFNVHDLSWTHIEFRVSRYFLQNSQ